MPIDPDDGQFLTGPFQAIEGWCIDDAAWLTTHLIRFQQAHNLLAPSFEIGVYKGKYLSVIQNCARRAGTGVLGFDTFEGAPLNDVEDGLRSVFGTLDGLRLIPADSTKLKPATLSEYLGGRKAGFVSIDGAHTPQAVFSDLLLAENALEPWGIIAIDDFLNPVAIGVNDGAMRFWFRTPTELAPFCFCKNKLFVAHRDVAGHYARLVPLFCEENQHLPGAKTFVERRDQLGMPWVQHEFLDQQIWVI